MPVSIWWIRRDLRLDNNAALEAAQKSGLLVLPVFILDDHLMKPSLSRRHRFLLEAIINLKEHLAARGSGVVIRRGDPLEKMRELVCETGATSIFAEEDFTPYARQRDEVIKKHLPLKLTDGLTIHHPTAVLKPDGSPYTVFTAFSRKWRSLPVVFLSTRPRDCFLPANQIPYSDSMPEFAPVADFPGTRKEAETRLTRFIDASSHTYHEYRDRMDLDGTSGLSPYIRFGLISASEVINRLRSDKITTLPAGFEVFNNELIWRDFYHSIIFHFPFVRETSFREEFRKLVWRNAPSDIQAWKEGRTGYPVVDAGMRQLKQTGWMHNRARMITASFLTKDLLINWQEGEHWFMDQLVDGDLAANNGGWQWAAGTGTDAAPYFRVFNPVIQGKKFDPYGDYVRRWLPELREIRGGRIHEPWLIPEYELARAGVQLGVTYPLPIVNHSQARERALHAYQSAGR
ncbi:cryptochrome/photolyase family protein [Leptolinea tardivitalis]|uniref:Deoxyribodipyrimidine photo-lyase n=1 Tax=Leptolinea tardivitalis TaxID=229920 RepID=A0A0P6WU67_9CHLR|nr:deoxyribodipyrimidine photo-lyase [Leptolinea tardivitalis]KPL70221.1 hypothetical protein ADM99_13625 [Leptolinea tardivitalis]GAP21760.1 deoxyribodipyrimidine photolyase [Leptolinea tardivitalis]